MLNIMLIVKVKDLGFTLIFALTVVVPLNAVRLPASYLTRK